MPLSLGTRRRLEVQGFTCRNEAEFVRLVPWMRFTPTLCVVFIGTGTALALTPLLWAIVPVAVLGAIFPVHPFDYLYNYGVRRLTNTPPLPHNGAPRRFACGVVAVWLIGTALAFGTGAVWVGYLLGGLLTAVGA